jgi:hypothetical protein
MPLRDSVLRAFEDDQDNDDQSWPLITELLIKHGVGLFIENTELFNCAVNKKRSDFLLKFKPLLSFVIRFVGNTLQKVKEEDSKKMKSFLFFAISNNDIESVRIILDCWIENLNMDINDVLTQCVYHAAYFFNRDDLIQLAEKYPYEFKQFICSIKLVKTHSTVLSKDILSFNIKDKMKRIYKASRSKAASSLWSRETLEGEFDNTRGQPVTSLFLPLMFSSDRIFLGFYCLFIFIF